MLTSSERMVLEALEEFLVEQVKWLTVSDCTVLHTVHKNEVKETCYHRYKLTGMGLNIVFLQQFDLVTSDCCHSQR